MPTWVFTPLIYFHILSMAAAFSHPSFLMPSKEGGVPVWCSPYVHFTCLGQPQSGGPGPFPRLPFYYRAQPRALVWRWRLAAAGGGTRCWRRHLKRVPLGLALLLPDVHSGGVRPGLPPLPDSPATLPFPSRYLLSAPNKKNSGSGKGW
jgi:hypothetical protein